MKKFFSCFVILIVVVLLSTNCKTNSLIKIKKPKQKRSKLISNQKITLKPEVWQPLPAIKPQIIINGSRKIPLVALTFDACEDKKPSGFDVKIVKILTRYKAKATMFLGGKWMESHKDETKLLAKNKLFELGNHSYIHGDFTKITLSTAKQEILKPQKIMFELTGRQGNLFRFPFGYYNKKALDILGRQGLKAIQWDVVTGDPDPNIKASDILRAVKTETKPGSIIIMHMNGRGWHTAEALPEMIKTLRSKGFELVTVSELIADN